MQPGQDASDAPCATVNAVGKVACDRSRSALVAYQCPLAAFCTGAPCAGIALARETNTTTRIETFATPPICVSSALESVFSERGRHDGNDHATVRGTSNQSVTCFVEMRRRRS